MIAEGWNGRKRESCDRTEAWTMIRDPVIADHGLGQRGMRRRIKRQ
jgi:hypothetical protein